MAEDTEQEWRYSDDIPYIIVEIEGHKFVATPGPYSTYNLAGPID